MGSRRPRRRVGDRRCGGFRIRRRSRQIAPIDQIDDACQIQNHETNCDKEQQRVHGPRNSVEPLYRLAPGMIFSRNPPSHAHRPLLRHIQVTRSRASSLPTANLAIKAGHHRRNRDIRAGARQYLSLSSSSDMRSGRRSAPARFVFRGRPFQPPNPSNTPGDGATVAGDALANQWNSIILRCATA